jgi:sugar phosphate isomerase/epimerase
VGCCAYSYRDHLQGKKQPAMTLDDFLNRMAEIGIDGVELTSYYFPDPPTAAYIHKIARRCFQLGLVVNGTAIGNRFTLPAGDERDKQIALVKRWIDYAVDMGAPCARIFAGETPKDSTAEQARKWAIECIETCCEYGESKGVMLALENHGGIVGDADGVLAILQAVKSDWFGMKWDSGNFHTADPYSDLTRTAPYAVTTHIKTEINPGNKKQDADLARVCKILRDAGYRGFLHLEYEAAEDPLVAVPRALRTLLALTA